MYRLWFGLFATRRHARRLSAERWTGFDGGAASVLRAVAAQMSCKVLLIRFAGKASPTVTVRLKNRTLAPVSDLFVERLRAVARSK
jgi:hypothetical protein